MKKVIVSVTNDLATDQRVQRVCQSLHSWGYEVLLVGRRLPVSPSFEQAYRYKRMRLIFKKSLLFYAEYNLRLFLLLLFYKADILLANDLDTLPANWLAAKIKRIKLVFDSHEYFPETPEIYKRHFVKSVWQGIEQLCVHRCDVSYTVSQSIADIFENKYNLIFKVIRNVPFRLNNQWELTKVNPYIIYQGSVNIGRGLELMFNALKIDPCLHLVIAGDGPELINLKGKAEILNIKKQVKFLGRLLPKELKEWTSGASLGISIEEPLGISYISALPNKLFDYIQAGIPALVSDFPEMGGIVAQYGIGMILKERNPVNLARILQMMITDVVLRETWKANLTIAAEELCWEKESQKLRELFSFV